MASVCARYVILLLLRYTIIGNTIMLKLQMTVRAYLNEFNTLSTIYSHKFYQRALRGALKVFIHLIDCPEDVDGLGHLSAAERKKEREKLKKAKKKREKAEEAKELAMKEDAKWNGKAGEDDKSKDEGEDGEKLLQKDFLVECEAWCTPIQNYLSLCDCETIALYAEANMKRGQYNLVIDAINIGTSKNSLDPSIMAVTAKFAVALKEAKPKKVSITVAELTAVKEEMRKLLGNPQFDVMPSLEKFIQYAIDSASLSHVIGAVKSFKAVNAKGDQYLDRIEQLLTLPKLLKDGGIKFASVSSAIKVSIIFFLPQYSAKEL